MPAQTELPTPTTHDRIVSLPTRFRAAPWDVIPGAALIMVIPGTVVAVLVMLLTMLITGKSGSFGLFGVSWIGVEAVLLIPALMVSNSMVNESIRDADKKKFAAAAAGEKAALAAKAEALAAERSVTRKYEALRDAIRLPLLEWAVREGLVDRIDTLAETLASAVVSHTEFVSRKHDAPAHSLPAPALVPPSSGLPG